MDKIKVLLVEDEETLAMIIKDTLEGQSFIIHTAADGEEGLRLFFDLRPDCAGGRRHDAPYGRLRNGTPHPPDRQAHAGAFPHCPLCNQ